MTLVTAREKGGSYDEGKGSWGPPGTNNISFPDQCGAWTGIY